jgi:hypothetical protein
MIKAKHGLTRKDGLIFLILLPLFTSAAYSAWVFFVTLSVTSGANFLGVFIIVEIPYTFAAFFYGLYKSQLRRPSARIVIIGVLYAAANLLLFSILNTANILLIYSLMNVDVLFFGLAKYVMGKNKSYGKGARKIFLGIIVLAIGLFYMSVSIDNLNWTTITIPLLFLGMLAGGLYGLAGATLSEESYKSDSISNKIFWMGATELVIGAAALMFIRPAFSTISVIYGVIAAMCMVPGIVANILSYSSTKAMTIGKKFVDSTVIYILVESGLPILSVAYYFFVRPFGINLAISIVIVTIATWYISRQV